MLPKLTDNFLAQFKKKMHENGYAIINTAKFLKNDVNWQQVEIKNKYLYPDNDFTERMPCGGSPLLNDCIGIPSWGKKFLEWHLELYKKALPGENVSGGNISFRETTKKIVERNIEKPHIDGGYIRSLTFLEGATTVFCLSKGEYKLPLFKTCIFTAKERHKYFKDIQPTKHYKPNTSKPRKLILVGCHGWKGDMPEFVGKSYEEVKVLTEIRGIESEKEIN